MNTTQLLRQSFPWNKGKLIGQKTPLKLREIWAIRVRLQISRKVRDLALFNLAIDSKLRACDLVSLRVTDVSHGDKIIRRAVVLQQKTQRPVQFELADMTRESLRYWILKAGLRPTDYLFPSRAMHLRIFRPANTPSSSTAGSRRSASTVGCMAPIPCEEPRLR